MRAERHLISKFPIYAPLTHKMSGTQLCETFDTLQDVGNEKMYALYTEFPFKSHSIAHRVMNTIMKREGGEIFSQWPMGIL